MHILSLHIWIYIHDEKCQWSKQNQDYDWHFNGMWWTSRKNIESNAEIQNQMYKWKNQVKDVSIKNQKKLLVKSAQA